MRQIYSSSTQYTGPSSSHTLHASAGKIYTIILTNSTLSAADAAFYDGNDASDPLILRLHSILSAPLVIVFPTQLPITFANGLTVVTGAGIHCFVTTEALA